MTDKLKHFFLSNSGAWVLFICWSLFISNLWLPRNWGFYGTDDWDLTYSTFEVARKSIVEYGQWPSYNIFCSFGSDLDANPQATHASIFFIPVLLFGTFYGYKVSILLAILIGCWGCFRLFSAVSGDRMTALCMSLVFCGCSYFCRHIFQAGHSNMLYFYFLPWLAHFLNRLRANYKFTNFLWPVLILFQVISGGAPFVFIVCSMFMGLWGIGLAWIEKSGFKPLLAFTGIIFLSVGLAFWKVWPVMKFWDHMPRHVVDGSGINLLVWLQALCDFETDTRTHHQWHEFAMGFNLVLVGITAYYFRAVSNGKKWIILFLFVFWLSMGNMPPYVNPWYLLNHYVPVFTSLRAPYRFGILIVFILSLAFIKSINKVNDKTLIYIILLICTLSQTLRYNSISKKVIGSPRLEELSFAKKKLEPMRMTLEQEFKQFIYIRNDRLVQNAYEPLYLDRVGDSMNSFSEGAQLVSFSPADIRLKATNDSISLNVRNSEHWHLKGNGVLKTREGLIFIQGARGELRLYYKNPYVKQGLIVSAISLLLLALIYIFLFRKKGSGDIQVST
jgi:hypothetical protein